MLANTSRWNVFALKYCRNQPCWHTVVYTMYNQIKWLYRYFIYFSIQGYHHEELNISKFKLVETAKRKLMAKILKLLQIFQRQTSPYDLITKAYQMHTQTVHQNLNTHIHHILEELQCLKLSPYVVSRKRRPWPDCPYVHAFPVCIIFKPLTLC